MGSFFFSFFLSIHISFGLESNTVMAGETSGCDWQIAGRVLHIWLNFDYHDQF